MTTAALLIVKDFLQTSTDALMILSQLHVMSLLLPSLV